MNVHLATPLCIVLDQTQIWASAFLFLVPMDVSVETEWCLSNSLLREVHIDLG